MTNAVTVIQMKSEIRRQLISIHGLRSATVNAFFEMWGPLIETLISCGATASEVIRDVWGVEDALDCIGWSPVGDDSDESDDPRDEENFW